MMLALVVAVSMIVLHTVDGHQVSINPALVTSLHAAKADQPNKLYTEAVRCVVGLADGKLVSVAEDCDTVQRMIEGKP